MRTGMLAYQPPGFEQRSLSTRLGPIAYYTSISLRPNAHANLPTVAFFHNFGGGASAYEWSKVYAALAGAYRIIAPDLIGWGESAHPKRRYTIEDYLNNIEDILSGLCEGPVICVASSFTAGLVVRLSASKPELFSKLFLTCPSGFRDFGTRAGRRIPEPIINTPFLDSAIYTLGATNELAVRNFLENFLFEKGDRLLPETIKAYLASAGQPNAEFAALSFLKGDLYFDLAPYMTQLKTPTAVLWGEKAKFTPMLTGRKLAALNPEAVQRFQVVSDTGVLPHLEQPGTVTALLLDWLAPAQ